MDSRFLRLRAPKARISGSELYDIVEKFAMDRGLEVSASTDDHEFDTLEDMRSNLSLLKGQVEIKIGPIELRLTSQETVISCHRIDEQETVNRSDCETLKETIAPFRDRFGQIVGNLWIGSFVSIVPFFVFFFLFSPFLQGIEAKPTSLGVVVVLGILYLWFSTSLVVKLEFRPPVIVSGNGGFWRRNGDKIVVGLIMLVAGVVIANLADRLGIGQ